MEAPAPISPDRVSIRNRAVAFVRNLFSFHAFLAAMVVVGAVASTSWTLGTLGASLVSTGDTWWHLVVGKEILTTSTWPSVDVFSYTAVGQHWIANEWLGDVLTALAERWGGLQGLLFLLLILVSALMLLTFYYAWLRSRSSKAAAIASLLVLPAASPVFTLRPQLLGYVFFAVTLVCLERFRQGHRRAIWLLPLIFFLWVNTHGSFVFGLFVLGVSWVSGWVSFKWQNIVAIPWSHKERLEIAIATFFSVLATSVSPYGTQLAAEPLRIAFFLPTATSFIPEWRAAPFSIGLSVVLLGFLLTQIYGFRPSFRVEEVILFLTFLFAARAHERIQVALAMIFAPLIATVLAHRLPPYKPAEDKRLLNATLMAVVVLGLVKFFPSKSRATEMVDEYFPNGAANYLEEHQIPAHMLNEIDWGGYLIWKEGYRRKVFIDGRVDMYEHGGVLSDYLAIERLAPQTPNLLQKYGVSACLIVRGSPLDTYLSASPSWRCVYRDKISTIFVKTASECCQINHLAKGSMHG